MPALTTAIPNVLVAFDDQLGDDFSQPALLLMFLDSDADGFSLAVKELAAGQHPLDELLGFVAPDDCAAIGTICHGWATQQLGARPSTAKDRRRLRALHVVCRDGGVVGGLHIAGEELEMRADAIGAVPDALRRALGLPTPPPDTVAAELSAADWLDAIARLPEAAGTTPAPYTSWEEPRWEVVTRTRHVAGLGPTLAAWMDEGIFARWMATTYPPIADHLAAIRRLVDDRTYRGVRRVLENWGVFS